jgi:hypothetical protein
MGLDIRFTGSQSIAEWRGAVESRAGSSWFDDEAGVEEARMNMGRREFAILASGAATVLWGVPRLLVRQAPRRPRPDPGAAPEDQPVPREALKAVLQENQKQIRKDVEKLYQLAEELKKEVEKADASEVLSLNVLRKAEEVEKLAKRIKNLARG